MCGQRVEPRIQSVWGFLREATESLTHADSRLWRTLGALLARPGTLTREFLAGRRARYLPPFRLYLVASVLFFVVASLFGGSGPVRVERGDAVVAPIVIEGSSTAAADPAAEKPARVCEELVYEGPWQQTLQPRWRRGCERAVADDGRALGRELMANMPRVLFLFLPLIALVMKLIYWRPKRYYVEHLLFFVHNHSFAFVLFTLLIVVSAPLPDAARGLLTFAAAGYCAWYFFRAMRVVYGQSRARTFAKYAALGVTYLASAVVLTMLTLAYTVLVL